MTITDDELKKIAEEIGDHCEYAVGLLDKVFLPYSSRKLRDFWVFNRLKKLLQDSNREIAIEAGDATWGEPCPNCEPGEKRGEE